MRMLVKKSLIYPAYRFVDSKFFLYKHAASVKKKFQGFDIYKECIKLYVLSQPTTGNWISRSPQQFLAPLAAYSAPKDTVIVRLYICANLYMQQSWVPSSKCRCRAF